MSVDSPAPSIPFRDFARNEARFTVLERQNPEAAERFMVQAEKDARLRHQEYLELAEMAVPEVVIAEKDREAAELSAEQSAKIKETPNA
jgi:pyruvate-ferredoxin/flavodoxin oxidoreductase